MLNFNSERLVSTEQTIGIILIVGGRLFTEKQCWEDKKLQNR